MFCYPILGLLSGVMPHLQLLAMVIPYSGNTKVRCDPGFSLNTFYIIKCNFCYPFLPLLGVSVRGKGNPKIASIGHSVLGNPKVRYDTGFTIAFYINICQFCYHYLLPLFGLRSGVKPSLRYLHWSVSTRRSLRYAMSVILILVLLHKLITLLLPLFTNFGVAVRGKATLEMLALVITYSENTIR